MNVLVEVASVVIALGNRRRYGKDCSQEGQYTGFHSDEDNDETPSAALRFSTKKGCLRAFCQKIHKNVYGVLKTPTFVKTYTA